jgi:iron complex outermembrane receptor protein
MKKYVLALLLMSMGLVFASATMAQQFTLTGKVFDKATGKTLPGASVYLPEIKKGAIANKEGVFIINIEQGSHVLEISYVGYATDVENIKLQKKYVARFLFK